MTEHKREKHAWVIKGHQGQEIHRTGYKIGPFGIYKGSRGGWFVDHLPSHMSVSLLGASTLAATDARVRVVLAMPLDWALEEEPVLRAMRGYSFEGRGFQEDLHRRLRLQ